MGLFKKKGADDSSRSGSSSNGGGGGGDSHAYLNEMALGDDADNFNENINADVDYFPEHTREESKKISVRDFLIFSPVARFTYILLLCLFLGLALPIILDAFVFDDVVQEEAKTLAGTCHVIEGLRTDCFPDAESIEAFTEDDCKQRDCCYQPLDLDIGAPLCHHRIPSPHSLSLDSGSNSDSRLSVFEFENSENVWPFEKYNDTRVKVRQLGPGHMGILFFSEGREPDLGWGEETGWEEESDLTVSLANDIPEDDRIQVRVDRFTSGLPLLDSSYGSHIVGEDLSELSFLFPSKVVYGLGGHPISFGGSSAYSNRTQYVSDSKAMGDGYAHSYTTMLARDAYRHYFGLEIESETPLTVQALPGLSNATSFEERPLLVFRSMGGYMAFHIYSGPDARDVLMQMNTEGGEGAATSVPPISALGYHVCRRTGDPGGFLDNFAQMNASEIPFDSDCVDEGLLDSAFEINSRLRGDLEDMAITDVSLAVQLPVQVWMGSASYPDGVYIDGKNGSAAIGMYKGEMVAIPDFFEAESNPAWWRQGLNSVLDEIEGVIATANGTNALVGVHLIHNAPYVDELETRCNLSSVGYIPNEIRSSFGQRSLCPDSVHADGSLHLTKHNDYAAASMTATLDALTPSRPGFQVLSKHGSRKVDPTTGGLFGSQFEASWDNMRSSLKEVLNMGLSGMPLVSMTACGVQPNVPLNVSMVVDDLCLRWYQMAAYMPAINSYYGTEENTRMPYDLSGAYRDWIKRALTHRLRLIPYMYSQLAYSLQSGLPLTRPLFLEFPDEEKLQLIWEQFMAGDSILVSPVLDPGATTLRAFIPFGTWYDLWSGQMLEGAGEYRVMDDIPYQISAYLRGGKTIPIMEHAESSIASMYAASRYSLISGLSCDISPRGPLDLCYSEGSLWLETGVDLSFSVTSTNNEEDPTSAGGQLTLGDQGENWSRCFESLPADPLLSASEIGTVVIYGLRTMPAEVSLANGTATGVGTDYSDDVFYEEDTGRLQIRESTLDFCDKDRRQISWSFQ